MRKCLECLFFFLVVAFEVLSGPLVVPLGSSLSLNQAPRNLSNSLDTTTSSSLSDPQECTPMGSFIQTSSGTKAANTTSIYSGTQPVDINSTSSSMRAFSISSTVSNLQNINVTSTPSSTQPISNLETSSGNKAAHTTSISSGTQPVGINSTFSSARALSSSSTLSNLQNFNTTSIPSKTQPISSLLTPSTFQTVNVIPTASGILPINPNACGSIQPYQQPNASSWATVKTDEWFNAWWTKNLGKFDPTYGFAESFGYMYTGNPNYDCQDNGADDNCQVDPCGNAVLNSAGSSMQPAYYVLKSMTHLRQYFKALEEAFVNAGIQAALVKDNWAYTYYVDKNDFSSTELSILIIALTTVINIVAAFACPLGEAAAMSVNAAAAAGGGLLYIDRFLSAPENSDDTPKKAAQMGATLASLFQKGMASFTQANNVLMKGLQFGNQDIRGYLSGGAYLTGPNPNISAITQTAETLLASVAINQLWKQQKIFIMGGGPCDDSGGIGNGPQEAKLCKNNQAWYLFYWQEYLGQIHLGKKQWGNVAAPPGMDTLASQGITVQDVIAASLDAFTAGGNNYSTSFRQNRTLEAIQDAAINPSVFLPSFEGNFNIPVCDVSLVVPISGKIFNKKNVILQPYGNNMVPQWCSPVCRGPDNTLDRQTTEDFINAANMHGFRSFQSYCPHGPWLWVRE